MLQDRRMQESRDSGQADAGGQEDYMYVGKGGCMRGE